MLPELLLAARPAASPALRERVRSIGASPARRRSLRSRRLALAAGFAVVVVAATAGLAVGLARHGSSQVHWGPTVVHSAGTASAGRTERLGPAGLPTTAGRLQDYRAHMELQVPNAGALSDRTKRAMRIAGALGGVVTRVDLAAHGESGTALIVMRVPIGHVQQAISELGALGRIVDQHVVITDAERRIETLRKQVQGSTGTARLTAQAELERELRKARLSTVAVGMRTPTAPVQAPHHESTVVRILETEGRIGLYAALIAGPILLLGTAAWLVARALRRRSDRQLLGT